MAKSPFSTRRIVQLSQTLDILEAKAGQYGRVALKAQRVGNESARDHFSRKEFKAAIVADKVRAHLAKHAHYAA